MRYDEAALGEFSEKRDNTRVYRIAKQLLLLIVDYCCAEESRRFSERDVIVRIHRRCFWFGLEYICKQVSSVKLIIYIATHSSVQFRVKLLEGSCLFVCHSSASSIDEKRSSLPRRDRFEIRH
jgi:hypothetical protein